MIREGTIIEGPFWKEPIEVNKVESADNYIRIIGAGIQTREHVDQIIPISELQKIRIKDYVLDFSGNSSEAFLALEAIRFRYASIFDPLLAMNISRVDPLPFQIEAVYGYILKLPIIRFLIADDPGAGKTIMAGLVIKELKLRGLAKRILVVVPGHLKDQWKRELFEKFNENFVVVDRAYFGAHYGDNPWKKESQIITSIDFAKQEDILLSLQSAEWDLVIVDEAHKMAAYKYGNKTHRTERYKLGEILSKTSTHMLFLTATPHKGDPENFRLLLDLLMPGFFATKEMISDSLKAGDNPLFIRRLKEDLKDFEGKPIFTKRYVKTVKYKLSDKEKELYNDLSRYVISQYNRALQLDSKRNIAFALLILQRRMASSTYALLKSLERRRKRLLEILENSEINKDLPLIADIEDLEDYDENEIWEEEKKWETLTVSRTREELKREIATIETLIERAKEILEREEEVKLKELKQAIKEGLEHLRKIHGNEKILIFTESRDTLEYLVERIRKWGYSVTFVHGGMKLEERIEAEKEFKHEKQIMVATEAAGEGINLQFCHLMINYDIPWNPNRLEQRMGRIHRYGQQKEVNIFNMVAEDTREGMVLSRVLEKIEEIRRAVGSDKVFDVIGDIFFGKDLSKLVVEAVASTRSIEEILEELEISVDEERIRSIKETLLGESLATRNIDYTRIKELAERAREHRLIPEYVQEFFLKAFSMAGGSWRMRKDGFISIESVPYEIRKYSENYDFKRKFGTILRRYKQVTFDKDLAYKNPESEFVSFGHPLLEATLEWVKDKYLESLKRGAVFMDPDGKYDGILWFFEAEVKDGNGKIAGRRVFALYESESGVQEVNPSVLWDLVPSEKSFDLQVDANGQEARRKAIEACEKYREEILNERKRQASIKEKYGIKSLEKLINDLDLDLVSLYEREQTGESVKQLIDRKEEKKKRYEEALQTLKTEIIRETTLSISTPKVITAVVVVPSKKESMVSDEEIERIGMQIALDYEKSQGRHPEDVSKENLGFDIRSKGNNEIRYIEVKARRDEGPVALTQNELFKAKRFKDDYWLYVVCNAATKPELYIIRNPAENLEFQEKVEVVRFLVDKKEWKSKGEKA